MQKLNLQQFAGSLTLTIYKDAGITTGSASATTSLAENDEVTLTITPASGYELDEVQIIGGGATFNATTKKLKMGATNAVINIKSKKNNLYKVVENTYVCVNGSVTNLQRNMKLEYGPNGALIGASSSGTEITLSSDIVAALVASGAIVKI